MDYTRLLVENILKNPNEFNWSVQGLGMMRLYLSEEVRLHIWDSALKVPGVSPMHNHPWSYASCVVAGVYRQYRFTEKRYESEPTQEFNCVEIKCGEGAFTTEDVQKVLLVQQPLETYVEGNEYCQDKSEIHSSLPEDGTVTIVKRIFSEDRDHAKVLWRGKGSWVNAAPRTATKEEVKAVTERALLTWF